GVRRVSVRAWQAGERVRRRVTRARGAMRLDRLEQGDAQALALEAAGTVERLFGVDVALDLVAGEGAEVDPGHVAGGEHATGAVQAYAGMEAHHAPAHRGQLGHRAFAAAG